MKIKMPDGKIIKIADNLDQNQISEIVEDYNSKFPAPTPQQPQAKPQVNKAQNQMLSPAQAMMQLSPLQSIGYKSAEQVTPRFTKDKSLIGLGLDIETLPSRFAASSISALRDGKFDLGKTESSPFGETGRAEDVLRAPGTTTSFLMPVAKIPQAASTLTKAGILATQGAKVGGVTGVLGQLQNVSEGKKVQPLQVAKETAIGAALNPAVGGVLSALAKVPGMTTKGLAAMSQKLSTPGEFQKVKPALEAFGWGGKTSKAKEIIENAGEEKTLEIGQKIYNTAQKISKGEIENKAIKEAVSKMPEINTKSTIDAINKQLYDPKDFGGSLEPWQTKINEELKGIGKRLSSSEKISAEQFLNKRKVIDKGIDFSKEGYDVASEFAKKMQNIRKAMKDELVDQAYYSGNDKYISNMKKWSDNIRAAEDFLNAPGGKLFESNPQSALGNLFGKNKTELQRSIKKLEVLSGEKLLEPAKYNRYANILGMESGSTSPASITQLSTGLGTAGAGVPMLQALLTGNSQNIPAILAGGLGTMALSSPRVAAGLASTAKTLEKPTRKAVSKSLTGAQRMLPSLRSGYLSQQNQEQR